MYMTSEYIIYMFNCFTLSVFIAYADRLCSYDDAFDILDERVISMI